MGNCVRCNGWVADYSDHPIGRSGAGKAGFLCSECARTDEQIREQRRLAEEQELNEIKRRLVDLQMEAVDDAESAARKMEVVMKGPDFKNNVHWFWDVVSGDELTRDVYFKMSLEPLIASDPGKQSVLEFFDDHSAAGRRVDLLAWLQKQGQGTVWREKALPLYWEYEKLCEQRETDRQKQAEEEARREAAVEAENARRNAEQSRREAEQRAELARTQEEYAATPQRAREAALSTACLLAGCLKAGWAFVSMFGKGRSEGFLASAYPAVFLLLFGLLLLLLVPRSYYSGRHYRPGSPGSAWWWLYWGACAAVLMFTFGWWTSLGGFVRLILLVAAFVVPWIPYLRVALGAYAVGVVLGWGVSIPLGVVLGLIFFVLRVIFGS